MRLFRLCLWVLPVWCVVTPDPAMTWGEWQGWGTSLCWWAGTFGQRDDLADAFFTLQNVSYDPKLPLVPGLGLSIARYNAGGSAWRTSGGSHMQVSPRIPSWKQMAGYWLDSNNSDPSSQSWDWSQDANQTAMLKKAVKRGAITELFSNSPMWWMCVNHNPSGADQGEEDNLAQAFYAQHAWYMAAVAAHFQSQNLSFYSVEAFNEPLGTWWVSDGTQEGCHFEVATQAAVLPHLKQALANLSVATLVASSDENTYTMALQSYSNLGPKALQAVDKVNVHGYEGGGGRRDLLYAAVHGDKKQLWNSEYGDGDASGMSLASNLNLDFRWLHPTAWVYWQVLDVEGWGLLVADVGARTISLPSLKYYVLAQYTRHIRPGMTIVDSGDVNVVCAWDKAAGLLVVVAVNYDQTAKFECDLSKFTHIPDQTASFWRTAAGENYTAHSLSVFNESFSLNLPERSVQTFEIFLNC